MADDTQRIEQEIAQAREELATTLDQLAERANPQRIAEDAKGKAIAFVQKPQVKYTLIGVAGLTVVLVVRAVVKR
ncbi:hypothetical protein GOHSU_22_01010 [Gordonia hirsuta DSM 44140 = NBRC 16056]|uniref:DUF3618 domain-containing protein n=1 Tax=Gordonia hirsuta DSM 44140 = NBRC 16056 TaxID=1121927 RepID=L7LA65_9ACTN|nr:DUF3618 domain-containing protein [Gordonia hirsuta]GAC57641.1 hypothetical protein GOHSU_22_01010 [Gordonia hirsuta DSM 44140 = NBRC 16056]